MMLEFDRQTDGRTDSNYYLIEKTGLLMSLRYPVKLEMLSVHHLVVEETPEFIHTLTVAYKFARFEFP